MKITKIGLLAIRGTKGIVPKLSAALGVHAATIYDYIRENSENLTKAAALKVIREETGLSDEQILEETETARTT